MDSEILDLLKENQKAILKFIEINSLLIQVLSFITFDQACVYLQLSPNYLKKLCNQNVIPCHKIKGKTLMFFKEELDDWINSKKSAKNKI
jgi:excisionase family DNA binding protein